MHRGSAGLFTLLQSLCAIALLASCVTPVPRSVVAAPPVQRVVALPGPQPLAEPRYVLGIGDEIEIRVPDKPDLTQAAKIRPDGKIVVPLIGTVEAAGRPPDEIEQELTRRFRKLSEVPTSGGERSYVIAVGDQLEFKFANHADLDQTQRVRPDGKISLPMVKTVQAEGRTPEDLEAELSERYGKLLKRVNLVVIVREYSNNRFSVGGATVRAGYSDVAPVVLVKSYAPAQIFVGGEIARPGMYPYASTLTALHSIFAAGGFKPGAEPQTVVILRKVGTEEPRVIQIDLKTDLESGTTNDIYLAPFDLVVVPKTEVAKLAELLDQYIFQVVPPLRNTSFNFIYNLRGPVSTNITN